MHDCRGLPKLVKLCVCSPHKRTGDGHCWHDRPAVVDVVLRWKLDVGTFTKIPHPLAAIPLQRNHSHIICVRHLALVLADSGDVDRDKGFLATHVFCVLAPGNRYRHAQVKYHRKRTLKMKSMGRSCTVASQIDILLSCSNAFRFPFTETSSSTTSATGTPSPSPQLSLSSMLLGLPLTNSLSRSIAFVSISAKGTRQLSQGVGYYLLQPPPLHLCPLQWGHQ